MQTAVNSAWNEKIASKPAFVPDFGGVVVESREFVGPLHVDDLHRTRNALDDANRVIREQEDRIRRLESLALTDELTGLLNRRGLLMELNRELSVANRDPAANGALVMIDLDGFKSINDTWGHAVGDEYLRSVAGTLRAMVRPSDSVARLGGDEFAILLTRISDHDAAIRVAQFDSYFNAKTLPWRPHPVSLRGSFGFANYSGSDAPEALMAAADLKLYAHKALRKGEAKRNAAICRV